MCSERQAENSWGLTVLDWFDQPKTCREDFFETVADQVELKWIGSFPEKKENIHTMERQTLTCSKGEARKYWTSMVQAPFTCNKIWAGTATANVATMRKRFRHSTYDLHPQNMSFLNT